ncbi:MAG: ATP-binding protein [Chitinophagaceae bacterium]|nr:ATP-binding protein [Chitinophagaceae bacterium]
MKQSIGTAARGDNYFPRPAIVAKILTSLNNESNIYLSGPRRIGKTSIMYHLQDFTQEDYHFIYTITESVDDENEFYKTIFEALLQSNEVNRFIKATEAFKGFLSSILDLVDKISIIKLKEGKEANYFKHFCNLVEKIELEERKVVIMIDEFPQTIQNIQEMHGDEEAKKFIQQNRELRQLPGVLGKIKFIYTGSISLYPMVEKVCSLTEINDLYSIEVKPLAEAEAQAFMISLFDEKNFRVAPAQLNYLVEKIKWLIPFHCQLMVNEVALFAKANDSLITNQLIDDAFNDIIELRNKPQFEPYFSRLKKVFKHNDYDFVIEVLGFCAMNDIIDKLTLTNLAAKHKTSDVKIILGKLVDDGYIVKDKTVYHFNSPLLQLWCKKHVYEEEDF